MNNKLLTIAPLVFASLFNAACSSTPARDDSSHYPKTQYLNSDGNMWVIEEVKCIWNADGTTTCYRPQ